MNRHADLVDEHGAAFAAPQVRFKRDEICGVEGIVEVLGDELDRVGASDGETGLRRAVEIRHQ